MSDSAFCTKRDRDVPGLECGYPLPCPHHTTVVMELRPHGEAPEIRTRQPVTPKTIQRLDEIGRALSAPADDDFRLVLRCLRCGSLTVAYTPRGATHCRAEGEPIECGGRLVECEDDL